jgi:hypothetical protein
MNRQRVGPRRVLYFFETMREQTRKETLPRPYSPGAQAICIIFDFNQICPVTFKLWSGQQNKK